MEMDKRGNLGFILYILFDLIMIRKSYASYQQYKKYFDHQEWSSLNINQ